MSDTLWQLKGQYFETCNCDFLCSCPESHQKAIPTKGDCIAAMVYSIEEGSFGDVALDGLGFVIVLRTPGPMIEGNWTVGVIVDERADATQREALGAIASGSAGGRRPEEPIYLENVGHPASGRLGLAKATRSHVHVFGIDWDDDGGINNGHFATFDWQGS